MYKLYFQLYLWGNLISVKDIVCRNMSSKILLFIKQFGGYIFNFRDIPEPVIVHFMSPLKSVFAMYLLAASITLTPGTIVVRLRDGEFQVHCYDIEMARDIDESVFVRLLRKMEDFG